MISTLPPALVPLFAAVTLARPPSEDELSATASFAGDAIATTSETFARVV